jgi:hypothetical protein
VRKSYPLARTGGLLTEEIDGEVLVYDETREIACRLNATAALVWRHCDGKRTIAELVTLMQSELGGLADEDMVLVALDNLAGHELIASGYEQRDLNASKYSRRRFIRRIGAAGIAAINLPVVYSMLVPEPAAAASGGGYPQYYFPTALV